MSSSYFDITKIAQAEDEVPLEEVQPLQPRQPIQPAQPAQPVQPPQGQQVQPQPIRPPGQPQEQLNNQRKVIFVEEQAYGVSWTNIIVQINDLKKEELKSLKTLPELYIHSLRRPDGSLPTWATAINPYKKNALLPAHFKLFSDQKNKRGPGVYSIGITEQPFFEQILQELTNMGFDVSQIQRFLKPKQIEGPQEQQVAAFEPIQITEVSWDEFILNFKKNNDVTNFIKMNRIGARWNPEVDVGGGRKGGWVFLLRGNPPILPSALEALAEFMRQKGFDVTRLLQITEKYKKTLEENKENLQDPNKTIIVRDISDNTKFLLSISFPRTPILQRELEDFVRFSFPSKANLTDLRPEPPQAHGNVLPPQLKQLPNGRYEPTGMRLEQENRWCVYGKFDEFYRFASLVKSRGWDVTNLRVALSLLLRAGKMERTRYPGELDGYEVKDEAGRQIRDKRGNPEFDYKTFYKDVEKSVKNVELFPKQKDGVRWLYERNNAILGDKTGTGKTLTTLAAAKMRLERSGGNCLIITLKATQLQWANEIVDKLGEDPSQVSFNPSDNKRWTIITYSNLSVDPQVGQDGNIIRRPTGAPAVKERWRSRQAILDGLFTAKYSVAIFDEAHLIKNAKSAMARIVGMLAPSIPFKWAASATSVANTAIDVHNVLNVVDHTLGKLDARDFNKEFVGSKISTTDFKDENKAKAALIQQEERAYNLRKWLTLSGAYLSRSQKSINPNLPEHKIGENYILEEDFDMEAFRDELDRLRIRYAGNAGHALAGLTGQRKKLAELKVPHTIAKAKEILDRDEKVLVFSNFRGVCKQIYAELLQYVKTKDPDFQVVRIMGDDNGAVIMDAVEKFKDPEGIARAMVISAKKGGTGISLENSASNVIMNDFDWSPYTAEQTEGRAFRINNFMPVNTHYMVVKGENGRLNPDEIFYKFVRSKIRIANIIQNLDAEAEEYILSGFNDAKIQENIAKARQEDREINLQLGRDALQFFEQEGIALGGNEDPDQIAFDFEDEAGRRAIDEEDDDDEEDVNKQASSWYDKASIYG